MVRPFHCFHSHTVYNVSDDLEAPVQSWDSRIDYKAHKKCRHNWRLVASGCCYYCNHLSSGFVHSRAYWPILEGSISHIKKNLAGTLRPQRSNPLGP